MPELTEEEIPRRVTIVEVGPRDGLQTEPALVPTEMKVAFVEALADAGLPVVEVTSFVSPSAVPQLADASEVLSRVRRRKGVRYPVLVPNIRGLDRAVAAGADAVAVFASATEAFSQANLRGSIDETFERFAPIASRARSDRVWLRGYISVAFHCPYSGSVLPDAVVAVAHRLLDLGCDEVAIADTIGAAAPGEVDALLDDLLADVPVDRLALHFHDTGGMALANVDAGLHAGIRTFDSSAGGLGGCPFAPGAPGNLATETLVSHLEHRGIGTGVDTGKVTAAVAALRMASSHLASA
ncbi:MAG: hydroxymethylglutaryl-CoA lyase [Chloroflexota bacterium]|nr:hydroxymethylglutaryl-CoA lyase [Chloroflexota bacterium]